MDFIRTDLAEEMRDRAMTKTAREKQGELDGIVFHEKKEGDIRISTIAIQTAEGEKELGRPIGNYVTISFPTAANLGYAEFLGLCDIVSRELRALCKGKKRVLVCGVGNGAFAADALGVIAARHVLVTHHLKEMMSPHMDAFADIAAITPGIMAKTGMESADMVKSAVSSVHPDIVVVIDALAAREADRLARTIQISDTGLAPGSGLGNHRAVLDEKTLGVPVIAIGVPTVVDTATLVYDALAGRDIDENALKKLSGFFVAPKEIDVIAENLGKLIGYAINRAFHGDFPYEEMAMMT
ncbi:MAG: GPR endopeptidase [Clostridia bacterium]|nr:GPR endopeptidase [Clostridia bacterium]